MAANPYADFLGSQDPRLVVQKTPEKLQQIFSKLGDDVERSYAPGKWTARQIVVHLADCEIVFAFRLRQAFAEANHVVQPFNQDVWATQYGAYTAADALAVCLAVRKWNLSFIGSLPDDAWTKKLMHPERGEMTMLTLLETIAGHDLNHLGQLEKIAG